MLNVLRKIEMCVNYVYSKTQFIQTKKQKSAVEKMRNIKLTLKFVGSRYCGWQIQKNGITVQQCLGEAINAVTGKIPKIIGCGRTDSGVHACGYCANFLTDSLMEVQRFVPAINAHLPDDIVCTAAEEVEDDFDACRSAKKKHYTYRILNSVVGDPFLNPFVYSYKFPLDIDEMKKAAPHFLGEHDFVGFASAGFTVKTTVRTIYSLDITKKGELIEIDVIGNGFLYNMVRIIAGTLIAVGCGKIKADDIEDIISSKNRNRAGATAPAKGLCLTEVMY